MRAVHLPAEQAFLRYVEIPGDDPPLLWLHGWQCSSTAELMPAAVQPALRGRRSLMIDFLGHGYSDRPADFGYTVEDHARTIVALIDALGFSAAAWSDTAWAGPSPYTSPRPVRDRVAAGNG